MEKLKVRAIIKAAWHQVKGSKGGFFTAFVALATIQISLLAIMQEVTSLFSPQMWMNPVFFLITLFIVSPLNAGFSMMGLQRARNEAINWRSGFPYYKRIFSLFATSLMSMIIVWISCFFITALITITLFSLHLFSTVSVREAYVLLGIAAFIFIFCLFTLATLLSFTFILMIDAKASPLSAPFRSIRMAWRQFRRLLLLNLSLAILFLISLIPIGLGLIFTLPLIYISYGKAYEDFPIGKSAICL